MSLNRDNFIYVCMIICDAMGAKPSSSDVRIPTTRPAFRFPHDRFVRAVNTYCYRADQAKQTIPLALYGALYCTGRPKIFM